MASTVRRISTCTCTGRLLAHRAAAGSKTSTSAAAPRSAAVNGMKAYRYQTAPFVNFTRANSTTTVRSNSSTTASSTESTSTSAGAAGAGAAGNPFSRAVYWYGEKLETDPIITKGLTAGFIGAMGDVLCQVLIDKPELEKKKNDGAGGNTAMMIPTSIDEESSVLWWFDAARTGRFFVLGVGMVGPWCHAWFGWLARTFPKLTPPSIITRVALDQLAFTPLILTSFISSLWILEDLMENKSSSSSSSSSNDGDKAKRSILTRLQETAPDLLVANWMVWGPAQLFNFRFVAQKYQVLFANMVSLGWNAYISFSIRSASSNADADADVEDEATKEHDVLLPPVEESSSSSSSPPLSVRPVGEEMRRLSRRLTQPL